MVGARNGRTAGIAELAVDAVVHERSQTTSPVSLTAAK